MRSNSTKVAASVLIGVGVVLAAAAPGTGGTSKNSPLVMTAFVQNGRTDVRRNEILVFKFSTNVLKGSVDNRTLQVNELTAKGAKPAPGARIVKGNVIYFDPSWTQRKYDAAQEPNAPRIEKDNPAGFVSVEDYEIVMPAAPQDVHTLRSIGGRQTRLDFGGSFRTNNFYDDPVRGQPFFIGDHGTGLLGFQPARSGATGLVDEDAVIVLEFSEPINIDTLDPASSVLVTRITVGEQVPGFIKPDPEVSNGRRFLFVPSVGFGTDTVNQAGWDIQVQLTNQITDLAGNNLKRPVTFPTFRTRYVTGKMSSSIVTEPFSNQTKMDLQTIALGGDWNVTEPGWLHGGVPTTFAPRDVIYTSASTGTTIVRTLVAEPLVALAIPPSGGGGCSNRPSGSRAQMLYTPQDVGTAAAITGVGWGPSSNALFAADHPEIDLYLGHTSKQSLDADFPTNVNVGNPQLMYKGEYTIPQAKNIDPTNPILDQAFFDWPTFTAPFDYDANYNLIFDAAVAGGTNCQILRIGFVPAGIAYPNRRAVSLNSKSSTAEFATDTVIYDIRFRKRRRLTYAISQWYQVASDTPVYSTPIVSPSAQPGGVTVLLETEGANGKPDPFNPGSFIADPTTGTGFSTNPSLADKHRFFRFRMTMAANLVTNQVARVTSMLFPYQF